MAETQITAGVAVTLVQVGVNYGDHGQDVTKHVEVLPDETLHDVARRLLLGDKWTSDHYDWRLEVQLVEPAPQRALGPDQTEEPF